METVKKELKYGHRTNVGFMPGNPEKVNQDRFLCMTDFAGYANLSFFAVMDGHGYYGHFASELVKQKLPEHLSESSNLLVDNSTALTNAVTKTAEDMADASFDVNFSGTTLISCLVTPRKVWCANVGDSRALMGRLLKDSPYEVVKQRHWMSIALSRDHKPNEIDECERITQFGGRIEAYQDEEGNPLGPSRVWLPDEDIPGLAMSRSIGDLVAASVGVSYEPEILEYAITPDDRFIVLGSDGIFEFITNEEVVKIVVPFWKSNDAQGACLALYKEAYARWIKEEEVIDDITAVVIFLP